MRGLIDRKGEQFAYLVGNVVYTLDGEPTGRLEDGYILDIVGNQRWRISGDGIYSLDSSETIGFLSSEAPDEYL